MDYGGRNIHSSWGNFWDIELTLKQFAGAGTIAQQITFLQTVIPWLDAQTYIARYAWDWCTVGNLVLANGLPSPLGQVFGYTA